MKITKISQQSRRKDRFSIYIDEKYVFSLNDFQLASSGLRLGKELTKAEVEEFATESQFGKMYERSLNFISYRSRSKREIEDYLKRTFLYPKPKTYIDKDSQRQFKKVEVDADKIKNLIERIMERLTAKGHIDDQAFAKAWVTNRQLTKKTSLRKLEVELKVKGIAEDIIATVLQNSEIDEKQNLEDVIIKKQRLKRYQDDKKLIPLLLRQGFNYDDIKQVLGEFDQS